MPSHFTQNPNFKAHFHVVKGRFMGSINGWTCELGARASAHAISELTLWQPSQLLCSIAVLALKMSQVPVLAPAVHVLRVEEQLR